MATQQAVSWPSPSDQFLLLGGGVLGEAYHNAALAVLSGSGRVKAPFRSRPGGAGPNLSAPFPGDDMRLGSVICLHGESPRSGCFLEIGCDVFAETISYVCGCDAVSFVMKNRET